jgi:phytoene dehydrogenase-like protein
MAGPAEQVDAVVIGGGVNGLVAATTLADAGWDVVLLEAGPLGGAVRSAPHEDVVLDLFSAFYPLSAASPVLQRLGLEDHGLRWERSPAPVAQPLSPDDERGAVIDPDPDVTAAELDAWHPGDGEAWLEQVALWRRLREPLMDTLLGTWPPVAPAARLARVLGLAGAAPTARLLALPVLRMGHELFGSEAGRQLLLGNSMHADIPPVAPGSGAFGWLLCMLAQDVGFPVPHGGAGELVAALARRARSAGARIDEHRPVTSVVVSGSRAVGVRTADGGSIGARRAVVAAVDAELLLRDLVGEAHLPSSVVERLRTFERDLPTVKTNWVLPGPVPWTAEHARRAATVHCGPTVDETVRWSADLESGVLPDKPALVIGQMALADRSRAPHGQEVLWAYTHLPRRLVDADRETLEKAAYEQSRRSAEVIDRLAPGALDGATHHFVQTPCDLQDADASLVAGGLNGGTTQVHQQLVFRPFAGGWGARLPVERLYLGGAAAHPGGGVHGSCGHNAARTALYDDGLVGRATAPARRAVRRRVFPD